MEKMCRKTASSHEHDIITSNKGVLKSKNHFLINAKKAKGLAGGTLEDKFF